MVKAGWFLRVRCSSHGRHRGVWLAGKRLFDPAGWIEDQVAGSDGREVASHQLEALQHGERSTEILNATRALYRARTDGRGHDEFGGLRGVLDTPGVY